MDKVKVYSIDVETKDDDITITIPNVISHKCENGTLKYKDINGEEFMIVNVLHYYSYLTNYED
jgi:hypothetical protein